MAGLGSLKIIIAGVDNFSKTLNGVKDKTKNLADGFTKVGAGLTAGLTLPILGVGVAGFKASADFNKAMANVATMIPGNSRRVNELKKEVQDLSMVTGKSTTDIAGGLYEVVSAFGDTSDTAKILELNTKGAVAGLASTSEAIALTSAVTKGYGDTSADAVKKSLDLAFTTVKLGQTNFPQLAEAMGRVVPLSKELGVSQEELFGVFATATGVTGKASEVSSQFRGVLQSLLAPSAKMKQLLEATGYSSGKAMLAQLGLQGTVKMITQKAKDANVPLQELIGSIEGQTIALALSGSQADVWAEKTANMKKSTGSLDEAFGEQSKGINKAGFTWDQFLAKLNIVMQKVGDTLAPVLMKLLDALNPVLDVVATLSPEFMAFAGVIAGVLASVGPLLVVAGQMIGAFSAISGMVASAGGVLALLSNPIGWVVAGVMALVGIVTFMVTHWESKWARLMAVVFPFAGLVALIIKKWEKIGPFVKLLFLPWIVMFETLWKVAKWAFSNIADFIQMVFKPLERFLDFVLNTLTKVANMALPNWVKEKIGLGGAEGDANQKLIQNAKDNKQAQVGFQGTLNIGNAPKGSTLLVAGDKGMDFNLQNGPILGGLH